MKATDHQLFRNACGQFATGVTIISTKNNEEIHGMTANGFMSVSLEPPLIAISVGNHQKMCLEIKKSGVYGVSILKESQIEFSNHFSGRKNPNIDIEFIEIEGVPVLSRPLCYFATKVVSTYTEGDHTLFIGEVIDYKVFHNVHNESPLIFYNGKYMDIV